MSGTQSCPLEIDSSPSPLPTKHTKDLPAIFGGTDPEHLSVITHLYSKVAPTEPNDDPKEPTLCQEQADLVNLILSGRNVFYTGSAGVGKSTVLRAFEKRFRAAGKRISITAPTGKAAHNVNGTTTWTFAGWTPKAHEEPIAVLQKNAHGDHVWKRLSQTDVLVIDEISMVENLHFERLNRVM
jgi:ATP-dependent DNA helicase PIF1